MTQRKRGIHYAWITLAGTCVMMAIGFGLALDSMGAFYPAVSAYLGTGTGPISSILTVQGLFMTVGMFLAGRIIPRFNYNRVLLIASIVLSGSYLAMSQFNHLWQWYVMAVPSGLAIAFIAPAPISMIISNWFEKKRGLASGIAYAFSGIAGMFLVPTCHKIIESIGWRNGYIYYGLLTGGLLIPTALFIIRKTPEEKGLLPYGAHEEDGTMATEEKKESLVDKKIVEYGITRKEAMRRPSFYLIFIIAVALCRAGGMNSHFPTHTKILFGDAGIGAMVSSVVLGMQLIFNVPLGILPDKIGIARSMTIYSLVAASGSLLLSQTHSIPLIYLGGVFYGIGMCQTMVITNLITRTVFGRKEYGQIQSFMLMGFALFGSLGHTTTGFMVDIFGSYTPSFIIAALYDIIAITCCWIIFRIEKDLIADNKAKEGLLVEAGIDLDE